MKYAVVAPSGIVENIIAAEPDFALPGKVLVEWDAGAVIGGTYAEGVFTPPKPAVAPDPVPDEISTKQFFMGLELSGKITKAEALDAVLHKIMPPPVQAIIDGMADPDDRYTATMHLMGSNNLHRDHPLVLPFAITQGMTEQDVDDFWRLCAAL